MASSIAAAVLISASRLHFPVRRRLVRLREAARSLAQKPHVVLLSLLGGVMVQGTFTALTAILAGASGLHLRLGVWFFAWPLAKLAALLPLSQGGLGVREAALAALLLPFGAPAALSVAVGLVWQTVIYTGGLLSGLVALAARRAESRSATRAAAIPQDAPGSAAETR
jgi:uncharacterized membrane protein YbhN (UPF0104 family)